MVAGPVSGLLVALMLLGCLFLWVGVPLGWLWIGSQVQGSASLGAALMLTMFGVIVTVVRDGRGARRGSTASTPPCASSDTSRPRAPRRSR